MRMTTQPLVTAMALSLITGVHLQVQAVAADGIDGLPIHTQPADAWPAVLRILAGRAVRLDVDAKGIIEGRLVVADGTGIAVLNTADRAVPRRVIQVCVWFLANSPSSLTSILSGHEFLWEDVRVGPGGVFLGRQRVADLDQVLFRVDRAAVRTVAAESSLRKRGPKQMAAGDSIMIIGAAYLSPVTALVGTTLVIAGIVDHHHQAKRFDVVYTRPSP